MPRQPLPPPILDLAMQDDDLMRNGSTKAVWALLLGCLLAAWPACSSGKGDPSAAVIPKISGSWELVATSSQVPGFQTGLEINLQQGQIFADGNFQETGQLSAAGMQQVVAVGTQLDPAGNITSVSFSGACGTAGGGALNGTLDANYNVKLSYNDGGGNVFSAATLLSSDLKTMAGTYTLQSTSGCTDSGTFTGTQVSKLSGTYTGQLILPDGTTDNASATLSESSASKFSANLIISGTDNTSLTLSGVVTGNAFSGQGTFQSSSVAYYGYFYQTIIESGINQGLTQSSIYLVDASDPNILVPAGTLTIPIPPP